VIKPCSDQAFPWLYAALVWWLRSPHHGFRNRTDLGIGTPGLIR
jgi:hypothetical protein